MKRSREPEETPYNGAALSERDLDAKTGDGRGGWEGRSSDNEASAPATKIAGLDLSDNDSDLNVEMQCSLPPHREPVVFSSYGAYEAHYRDQHSNRCAECRKNFPSAHLLSLHIEETHDSFVQARRERGERTVSTTSPSCAARLANFRPQYSCFVEGCDRKCSTPQKRRMHLIDKHMYPKNFFFAITREGIDGRRSLLLESSGSRQKSRTARAAHQQPSQTQAQGQAQRVDASANMIAAADERQAAESNRRSPEQLPEEEMEDLTSAMSSLRFVPMSVRFGRGKRAGFAKR
ncbi:hypothetical protein MYCTH_2305080 [Thermothelomyces thermophilus ATCC 42464]|uniref:C2H2-type domain-containing protein n=1 Tax=Thermothelomyces thermophilus (strain ATCC 42464 / BCRC 31852 / DSM 1799) TaxID=573729 RepID=G2QBY0_THET4|nr:uncharacterized protein MYCTH_2305080 [Thermothelomyces thermophilus ATCC 42464]AEO58062.1 hypothetical protein MYCTH_2305080 [Thermothelomyces thermophilus ATCC 42464]